MVDGVGTNRYSYDAVGPPSLRYGATSQLLSEGGLWTVDAVSEMQLSNMRGFKADAGMNGGAHGHQPKRAWFCLRSQPKHEHIAAARLRRVEGVEVFVPRIRFQRLTRRGPDWVTEALFPNYLFARFEWKTSLQLVHHSPGVAGVVHFGRRWPTIPDAIIDDLRAALGPDEVHVIPAGLKPGDQVRIAGGSFHGFAAVITQVMPGRDRVGVLLDFLGRQTTVELSVGMVVKERSERGLIR